MTNKILNKEMLNINLGETAITLVNPGGQVSIGIDFDNL